ncbi:MAG: four helix bundle protein [Clostridia bacterium]|nr:four helix bundle protein [Clostridia bacterium]
MDLVEEVYRISRLLPKDEKYALSDQLRRAVVSIPSNIAEGYGRYGMKEYARFLNIARGSKYEMETQLLICVRLQFIAESEISKSMNLCNEIGKMLNAMINKRSPQSLIPRS